MHDHTLAKLVFPAVVGLIVYSLGTISARRKARREGGWHFLDPGFLLIGLALAVVALTGLILVKIAYPAWAIYLAEGTPSWNGMLWPLALAAVVVACGAGFALSGVRFNDKGIEFRDFFRRTFLRWRDIKQINLGYITNSGIASAKIISKQGKKHSVLTAMRGFHEMISVARKNGVTIKE